MPVNPTTLAALAAAESARAAAQTAFDAAAAAWNDAGVTYTAAKALRESATAIVLAEGSSPDPTDVAELVSFAEAEAAAKANCASALQALVAVQADLEAANAAIVAAAEGLA